MNPPPELARLRWIVGRYAHEHGLEPYDTLASLGFEILDEFEPWDYPCTPVNSAAFGASGVDGLHFNLLTEGPAMGAVVMTAPGGEVSNLVVGATFQEFLRLGYHSCFAWLEALALDPGRAGLLYRRDDEALTDLAIGLRDRLRRDFRLAPIEDVGAHLRHLQARHRSDLVLFARAKATGSTRD
jgi:hypothetical protein